MAENENESNKHKQEDKHISDGSTKADEFEMCLFNILRMLTFWNSVYR